MQIKQLLNTIAQSEQYKISFYFVKNNTLKMLPNTYDKVFMLMYGGYKVEQITIGNQRLIINVSERK
jgi:hypothetical protein